MMKKIRTLKGKMLTGFAMMLVMMMAFTVNVNAAQNRSSYFNKSYTLTGTQSQDLVSVAKAQIGRTMNQLRYTEAWCANFVLDCARLANISSSVIPYNYKSGANCGSLYTYMTKYCNAKETNSPQAGDIVFYKCTVTNSYVHVGIYDGTGYMIEGNINSKVTRYNTAYKDSHGHTTKNKIQRVYVRPNYPKAISGATITLKATSYTYTGKAITPSMTVKYGSTTLKKGTDYTCTITNNVKTGVATVTVKGIGNYTGTKKTGFYIVPKTPTGLKLKVSGKKLTVSYNKSTGATGYQIQYRKKGTSSWSTVTCTAASKTFSLARWTNYQVRVRAYVRAGIEYKYSGWSSIVTKRTGL